MDSVCFAADRLAVGVSGGADSMCLLAVLAQLRGKENIVAVHVQHGIRGAEAIADAEFVVQFCQNSGIECLRYDVDVPAVAKECKISIESAARKCRMDVFDALIRRNMARYVALAHHEEDNTESVLMHVFRGSGTGGMRGMTKKDGILIRPLLDMTKQQILRYLAAKGIAYREDSTNGDTQYARNFIRREVIPLIAQRYDIHAAAKRLSCLCAADDEFICSLISGDEFFVEKDACSFAASALKKPYALASRYVITALEKAGLRCDIEKKHIDAVLSLDDKQNGSEIDLPHEYAAAKEYDLMTVYKKQAECRDETGFAPGVIPFAEGYVSVTSAEKIFEKGSPVFDGDKIPPDAVIRFRRDGDVFTPYKGGTKKLKEYFIDEKVPKRFRSQIPLICAGNKVLCICGMEIADEIKVTNTTNNCLKFIYSKE